MNKLEDFTDIDKFFNNETSITTMEIPAGAVNKRVRSREQVLE